MVSATSGGVDTDGVAVTEGERVLEGGGGVRLDVGVSVSDGVLERVFEVVGVRKGLEVLVLVRVIGAV